MVVPAAAVRQLEATPMCGDAPAFVPGASGHNGATGGAHHGGDMNAVTVDGPRGLDTKYLTHCDPRLNSAQALEIAFMVAERLRGQAGLPAMLD